MIYSTMVLTKVLVITVTGNIDACLLEVAHGLTDLIGLFIGAMNRRQ